MSTAEFQVLADRMTAIEEQMAAIVANQSMLAAQMQEIGTQLGRLLEQRFGNLGG